MATIYKENGSIFHPEASNLERSFGMINSAYLSKN